MNAPTTTPTPKNTVAPAAQRSLRPDFAVIANWIQPSARVLDLGCGDGELLRHLQQHKKVTGYGIELDDVHIPMCIASGINVIQSDLDQGLAEFDDDSFDTVILSLTLQAMRYPDALIEEMLRVGTQGIVSFPNMGHWWSRVHIALRGRMPVTNALPHAWYNTPNIHLCTLKDFESLCQERGIRIIERHTLQSRNRRGGAFLPNFFSEIALYRFTR